MTLDVVRDIAVNVVVYLPLGCFAFAALASVRHSLALGFALSTVMEIAQVYIANRVPSLLDIAANTAGTAIGIAAAVVWRRVPHRQAPDPCRLFLLCCWALFQCFPLIPWLHRTEVIMRSSLPEAMLFFAEAMALVVVAQKRRRLLGAMLLLVPLKSVIYTRSVTAAEVVLSGVVFAIAWLVPVRAAVAAVLLGAAVTFSGLRPFHFDAAPHPFSWVPFQESFGSEWEPALSVLLGKLFAYGALLWLTVQAGVRRAVATGLVALLLGCIEAIQTYLPGRSAEILDPLIAVILGFVFWSLGRPEEPGGGRQEYLRRGDQKGL